MADADAYEIFQEGVEAWNNWRRKHPRLKPDLSGLFLPWGLQDSTAGEKLLLERVFLNIPRINLRNTDLSGLDLRYANLTGADLRQSILYRTSMDFAQMSYADLRGAKITQVRFQSANLSYANLKGVDLRKANLSATNFWNANLSKANLRNGILSAGTLLIGTNLQDADLSHAYLGEADLSGADMRRAILKGSTLDRAIMVETNLEKADLSNCSVFGSSVWRVNLSKAKQQDITITPRGDPVITVDSLDVAQFIYLLLHNEKIRDVIETIGKKAVLLLGRFTPKRKSILNGLRGELRNRGYLPILFDFGPAAGKDRTQTVATLARLARFIIADVTSVRSVPHELAFVVPTTKVPVQPILLSGRKTYALLDDLRSWHWVLETYLYTSLEGLVAGLGERVIGPAEAKARELEAR